MNHLTKARANMSEPNDELKGAEASTFLLRPECDLKKLNR